MSRKKRMEQREENYLWFSQHRPWAIPGIAVRFVLVKERSQTWSVGCPTPVQNCRLGCGLEHKEEGLYCGQKSPALLSGRARNSRGLQGRLHSKASSRTPGRQPTRADTPVTGNPEGPRLCKRLFSFIKIVYVVKAVRQQGSCVYRKLNVNVWKAN